VQPSEGFGGGASWPISHGVSATECQVHSVAQREPEILRKPRSVRPFLDKLRRFADRRGVTRRRLGRSPCLLKREGAKTAE
jgi:hypothetical protein